MRTTSDIAHLVAERAFGLTQGVWGSIAAGAVFGSMEVLSGRLRHDRHRRSAAVLRANADQIGLAEVGHWLSARSKSCAPSVSDGRGCLRTRHCR